MDEVSASKLLISYFISCDSYHSNEYLLVNNYTAIFFDDLFKFDLFFLLFHLQSLLPASLYKEVEVRLSG